MKTFGNLWPAVTDFENIYRAALKAARGKRRYLNVNRFLGRLEYNTWRLRDELLEKTYAPGGYHTFEIRRPKPRTISAAPFGDRVVHHALCNVIVPLFERGFIYDTYASRFGKGTHAAINRFQEFSRRYRYVLQCDVCRYFQSVDHEILKRKVKRVLRCPHTLWLAERIIDHGSAQEPLICYFPGDDLFSPGERRRGLPVGNLTSQFFGNVYLDALDHFVKEQLRCPGYVRYLDDFVLFAHEKTYLWHCRREILKFLRAERLSIHEERCRVRRTKEGLTFLGFRIWPAYRRLARANVRAMHSRLKRLTNAFAREEVSLKEVRPRVQAWLAHAAHGDTRGIVKRLLANARFVRTGGAAS